MGVKKLWGLWFCFVFNSVLAQLFVLLRKYFTLLCLKFLALYLSIAFSIFLVPYALYQRLGVDSTGQPVDMQGHALWPKVHDGKIYNHAAFRLEKLSEITWS